MTRDENATPPAGCPAVSISSEAFRDDPFPTYEHLRKECPVAHSDEYFPEYGGVTVLSRYADVRTSLADWKTYTSAVVGVTSIPMVIQRDFPLLPIEVDPPLHTGYRTLIAPAFRKPIIEQMRPRVREILDGLLDGIDALDGSGDVDLVADLVVPFSTGTLGEFMQLPSEDQQRWAEWGHRLFRSEIDPDDAVAATREMVTYLDDVMDGREAEPQDDLITLLLTSEVDGQRMTRSEIRGLVIAILGTAGHETSASAMSSALYELAANPDALRELREDEELLPTAVEEMLRLSSPVQLFGRNTTRDVELHGETIPAGAVIAAGLGSANTDPEVFPEPYEMQLDRKPNRHLTFGVGPHNCVGAPIARLEMELLLSEVARRYSEIRIADPDALEWNPRLDRRGLWKMPATLVPTT